MSLLLTIVLFSSSISPHQAHLNAALLRAAASGSTAKIAALLDRGADINTRTLLNQTPLELAVEYRHKATIGYLLQRGASANVSSVLGTPLTWATLDGDVATVNLLLTHGAWADYSGQEASPMTEALLMSRTETSQGYNVASEFIQIPPNTPHNRRLAKLWVAKDKEKESCYFVGFHVGAWEKRHAQVLQIIRLLLAHGANVNREGFLASTPLMSASLAGNADTAQVLIDHGAVIDARDKSGLTALWDASLSGSMELVKLLVSKGATVDAQGDNGSYPLLNAVAGRNAEMVQFLLEHGANPNLPAKSEETALNTAKMYRDAKIVALLQDAGAK